MFRIYGLDPAKTKLSRERAFELIHPEDRPVVRETFEHAVRAKCDYEIEHRAFSRAARSGIFHALGHPVLDESGALTDYVGTVMDITDSKQAENLFATGEPAKRTSSGKYLGQLFCLSRISDSPTSTNMQRRR